MDTSTIGILDTRLGNTASDQAANTLNADFDNFLSLLTTQLQHQDPLDPMDSNEFTNQLVAFSGVEQQIRANDLLEQQLVLDTLNLTSVGLSYIGLDVVRQGDSMQFDGSNELTFSYELPDQSKSTTISIVNESGDTVFSSGGETNSGLHDFTWDGTNGEGFTVPAGIYRVNVSGLNLDDQTLNITTNVPGHVSGIETNDQGDVLLDIAGELVPITDIRGAYEPAPQVTAENGGEETPETGGEEEGNT